MKTSFSAHKHQLLLCLGAEDAAMGCKLDDKISPV